MGATHERETDTVYCTPDSFDELVWASETKFKAHQKAETEAIEAKAKEEAEAASYEVEKELAAAEIRAEDADAKVEEDAATVEDEAEQERRSQPAPTRNAPAPAPAPAQESNTSDVTAPFKNCTEAGNAGATPVLRGEPGYGSHLDRDNDGIGCE